MSTVPPQRKSRPRPELRLPTESEAKQADEACRQLDPILDEADAAPILLVARQGGADRAELEVPRLALALLGRILDEFAQGNAVRLETFRPRLSIAEVADLLGITRPSAFKLAEEGELPGRKGAGYWEISLEDLMAYKRNAFEARGRILDELVALGQEMGMGY